MRHRTRASLAFAVLCATLLLGCRPAEEAHDERGHGHDPHADEEARGPHGGRLLRDGSFTVELAIFERGVPPEYRAWVVRDRTPLPPEEVRLTVELDRFGDRTDLVRFAPAGDHLRGDRTVEEPHSFVVTVRALSGGETYEWRYESFEGRTTIAPADAAASGIAIETAGPARIRERIHAVGRVTPNLDALARIVAPYPGTVRRAGKRVGDAVAKGELLAVVEASQTLRSYEIRSPLAGVVLARDASPGEVVADRTLYTVADLSTLWVELLLKPADAARARAGQPIEIAGRHDLRAESTLDLVSPAAAPETQTIVARASIANADGRWQPGLLVRGEIVVAEVEVPVAVRPSALQTFRDWDVVFLNDGPIFQAMPVELERRDAEAVEILSGVAAGQRYAAEGSFVVKADVEKSGATHDH